MTVPLAFQDYFAPVADWDSQISSELDWQTPEGISVRPVYCKSERIWPHAFDHGGWFVRRDVHLSTASKALAQGATALGLSELADAGTLQKALAEVPLQKTPIFLEGPLATATGVERLIAAAEYEGIPSHALRGGVAMSAKAPADALVNARYAARETSLKTIQIDLVPWHQAGATLVHELAFAIGLMADTLVCTQPEDVAGRIYFTVPVGPRYLVEIARLRAMRHLITQVFAAFGIANESVLLEGVMSGRFANTLDPETHLVRLALQHTAAVVGGCDVIRIGRSDQELNMHLILQHEAMLCRSADVAAGSWYVEALTEQLGTAAWALFQELHRRGGFLNALDFAHQLMLEADAERKKQVRCGTLPFVGVNRFAVPDVQPLPNPDADGLASPFAALRNRLHARSPRPVAHVLPATKNTASRWARRMLNCAGFTVTAASDEPADVVVAFSRAQAASVDGKLVVHVAEQMPSEPPLEWLVLHAGQDMVTAATQILDAIDG